MREAYSPTLILAGALPPPLSAAGLQPVQVMNPATSRLDNHKADFVKQMFSGLDISMAGAVLMAIVLSGTRYLCARRGGKTRI